MRHASKLLRAGPQVPNGWHVSLKDRHRPTTHTPTDRLSARTHSPSFEGPPRTSSPRRWRAPLCPLFQTPKGKRNKDGSKTATSARAASSALAPPRCPRAARAAPHRARAGR
eukprot:scaffold101666_cov22-Tisochrysis_lutea.AAC.1